MIDQLTASLFDFPGAFNRARCITHILNLIVKSIMHQFDILKKWWDATSNKSLHDLQKLAGNIEEEKEVTRTEEEHLRKDLIKTTMRNGLTNGRA